MLCAKDVQIEAMVICKADSRVQVSCSTGTGNLRQLSWSQMSWEQACVHGCDLYTSAGRHWDNEVLVCSFGGVPFM